MNSPFFALALMLAVTIALLVHSWKFRGPGRTLVFFVAALLYSVAHEIAFHGNGYFFFTTPQVAVGGVPLIIPLFWASAMYCAWWAAEYLIKQAPGKSDSLFPTVYLIGVTSLALYICVMTAAGSSGLIRWNWARIREYTSFWMPVTVIFEWTISSVLFFIPVLLFTSTSLARSSPIKIGIGLFFYFVFVYVAWIPQAGIIVFLLWLFFSWRIERVRLDPESLADAYPRSA